MAGANKYRENGDVARGTFDSPIPHQPIPLSPFDANGNQITLTLVNTQFLTPAATTQITHVFSTHPPHWCQILQPNLSQWWCLMHSCIPMHPYQLTFPPRYVHIIITPNTNIQSRNSQGEISNRTTMMQLGRGRDLGFPSPPSF